MRSLIRFFAKEHLLGNLLTILILIAGVFTIFTIRRDIWPNVQFNLTTIATFLGGASPEQVEKLVVNPIEEALREVDGIKKVFSTATENQAVVIAQLDPDARDANKTNSDIQQAIDRLDSLPATAEKPVVNAIEAGREPVIEVTVAGDKDEMQVRNVAKYVADELSLERLVSKVTKRGYNKREFVVEADPVKLSHRRVPLAALIQSIESRNISLPGGSIQDSQGVEVLVRTEGEYSSAEEIGRTVILANEAGFGTKIRDVEKITESLAPPERLYRTDGEAGINMIIAKKQNADALELVDIVRARVAALSKKIPEGIRLGFSNDFSVYLANRLNTLSSNLAIGLVLVIIMLSLFLPWRVTLVVALGIPIALLASLSVAQYFGISLNLISLIGLIIVLGMLVDDAIVVSENIWRHIEDGEPSTQAIVEGTREVTGPVLASVLTTVSAFAPMMFMTGIFGSFVFQIPLMVILALAISLFEAFLIMPSHFASWVVPYVSFKPGEKKSKSGWYEKLVARYSRFVAWSLNRRYLMLGFAGILLASSITLIIVTGRFVLFPPGSVEIIFVSLEAPTGTSLEKMVTLVEPVEKKVAELPKRDLLDFMTSIGIVQQGTIDPQTRRGSHYAHIRISLTPKHKRDRTALELIDQLRTNIGKPQGFESVSFEFAREGPPQGRPISLNVIGPDFQKLQDLAAKVKNELENISGVVDIRDSFVEGKPEWKVLPRFEDSAMLGLSASEIGLSVRAAFEGIIASSIRELDEEVDIRVRLAEKRGDTVEQLQHLQIGNRLGNLIPLSALADFKKEGTLSAITHLNSRRMINVSAEVQLDMITSSEVISQIRPTMKKLTKDLPEYSIGFGGEDEDTQESMTALARAFIFAAFIIFSLLIVTFRNLFQPILILTSIPLGLMGVIIAMFIHNRPLSFMALLGVIALAGVIVNNAIVLIDFINRRRENGDDLNTSVTDAATVRLRPILLTTATTVSGLFPTAYGEYFQKYLGIGGGDPFIVPIALALGWGLAFGAILTLVFFPSFVRILDDIRSLINGLLRRTVAQ